MAAAPIALYADAARLANGLVGSYVNRSLRSYSAQNDWRVTQVISGRRLDRVLYFPTNGWGARAPLGLTGGSDASWDDFSVQWDGYVEVLESGTRLTTRSDDGSRLWIDLNNDGVFASSGSEFVNNNWGHLQGATTGPPSHPLAAGFYRIRIQYEDGIGDNFMNLIANSIGPVAKPTLRAAYLIPSNRVPQPNGVLGSDGLARFEPEFLIDDRSYVGMVIPTLGPYPLTVGTNTFTVVAADGAAPQNFTTHNHQIIYASGTFDGDGDLLPDVWELQFFGAINAPQSVPGADPDLDGHTNVEEHQAGTDPTSAASVLRFESVTRVGPEVWLRFVTVAGKRYQLEEQADLAALSWSAFATNIAGTGGVLQVTHTPPSGESQRYYRIRLQP